MSAKVAAAAQGGAKALFGSAVKAREDYVADVVRDEVVNRDIVPALKSESVEKLVETYRKNGWGDVINEEVMQNIFGVAESDPENAKLAKSIARFCVNIGMNNPFMVMEESVTIFTTLGPQAQGAFVDSLQPFAKEEGRLGEAFKSFINFLKERMAQKIADVPQASRITFLHWLQDKGAKLLQEVMEMEGAAGPTEGNWFLQNVHMMPDRLQVTEERIKGIITGWVRDRDSELHFFLGGPSLWYLIYPEKDNDDEFNVNFKLRLHNESNEALHLDQIQVVSGFVKKAIVHQEPGTKGYMHGRKLGHTATGCVGTMAWTIGNTGKLFVVMYSIPYDQNSYSNWLGAGIFDKDPEYSMDNLMDFFNKMYYGDEFHFARKDFYYDQLPLTYSRDEFAIRGIMDATHQCNIEITFCSAQCSDSE